MSRPLAQLVKGGDAISASPMPPMLQRKCTCGGHTPGGGACPSCAGAESPLQRKSGIGGANDRLEREADQVADQLLSASPPTAMGWARPDVQHSASAASARSMEAPASVADVIAGPGQPIESAPRRAMERRLGHDFSQVRVHQDGAAARSARDLGAHAFTAGSHIVFGAGEYAPRTATGMRLLAHELTHVVQQRRGAGAEIRLARLGDFKGPDDKNDPAKLTDGQIEATVEYKAYMNPALVWQTKDKITREEALLACRLMVRHLREGKAVVWETDGRIFMNLARRQLGTEQAAEAQVGKLEWVPFSSGTAAADPSKLQSDFGRWLLAGDTEPDKSTGKVNCWEMVMFSAFKGGFTSKARIQGIYDEGVKQVKAGTRTSIGDTFEAELRRGQEYVFDPADPKSPEPLPGDIIIFTTAANHAAISMGTKDGAGRHKIVSHWPPPDGSHKTKVTTIEELIGAMAVTPTVKFWSPQW